VLYVCGHSGRGRDGNKTAFQHHGMWFATHGYACLLIDTLQLGEIAAIHHGTYRFNRWWWQACGYTPAAVECWNGIRAIDYLQSRLEVDGERIAVTGISGGGAATFWIAAADERVKVAVPVSGMSDLEDYVGEKVVNGHCDCMFLINTFQWPWTHIAALHRAASDALREFRARHDFSDEQQRPHSRAARTALRLLHESHRSTLRHRRPTRRPRRQTRVAPHGVSLDQSLPQERLTGP
jgi:dienelactone hydrolase